MKKGKGKMTSLVWSIVKTLWPFLWEMVAGKKTLKQAIRTSRKSLVLIVAFCLMLVTTILAVGRLITLSKSQVELERICTGRAAPVTIPATAKPPAISNDAVDLTNLTNDLSEMKRREQSR